MSDLYSEWIVKRKAPAFAPIGKIGLIIVTVLMFLISFTGIFWFFIIPAAGMAYLTYRMFLNWDSEFEYTYVKGELDVDRIMGKSKRKRCAVFAMDQTEIIAPEDSYLLDNFKNQNCKVMDFSSGIADHKKYVMYTNYKNEMVKVLLEPNERMIQDMKNTAPRKVTLY